MCSFRALPKQEQLGPYQESLKNHLGRPRATQEPPKSHLTEARGAQEPPKSHLAEATAPKGDELEAPKGDELEAPKTHMQSKVFSGPLNPKPLYSIPTCFVHLMHGPTLVYIYIYIYICLWRIPWRISWHIELRKPIYIYTYIYTRVDPCIKCTKQVGHE